MVRIGNQSSAGIALAVVVVLAAPLCGQDCPPCQEHEGRSTTEAKALLAEAFRLSLEVVDCSQAAGRDVCRQMEALLEDVSEAVDSIFTGHVEQETVECLTCDPGPHLWPLLDGVRALTALLDEKGDVGFADSRRSLLEKLETWKDFGCPCSGGSRVTGEPRRKRSREAEARAEIARKCGEKFADGRVELLQVLRVPNDREGCYQSRACRESTVYNGFQTQAGFWTYDGEYWYIWAKRRGTGGEWITCEP